MKHLFPLLVLLAACGTGGTAPDAGTITDGAPMTDATGAPSQGEGREGQLVGEFMEVDGVGHIRLCGSRTALPIDGPASDSLARVCSRLHNDPSKPTKVWFNGRLDEGRGRVTVYKLEHHAATLRCEPLPDPALAGRFEGNLHGTVVKRTMVLDLFPDGSAFSSTDLKDGRAPVEDDGQWGVDTEGLLYVYWPRRGATQRFDLAGDVLTFRSDQPGIAGFSLERTGAPERVWGTHGEVVTFLVEQGRLRGKKITPEEVQLDTPLTTWYDGPEEAEAFRKAAMERFGLPAAQLERQWATLVDTQDLLLLVRNQKRMQR